MSNEINTCTDRMVHLHVHTEFSLLDGACRIKDLVKRVKDLGQQAVAITDHGNMYGVIDFYRACKSAGIKPIIGCEVYVAPRRRTDKTKELDGETRHLVLLCKNETGYRNLSYMVSMANIEGFYRRPRIDMELLEQYHEGLIAMSACLAGEIPRRLSASDYEGAKQHALRMLDLMGEGNYYLELQDHGIPEQQTVNAGIIRLHQETGIPLVATNDAHYITNRDAVVQDVLMCVQMGKTLSDENRMRFATNQFYIKSGEEMAALFPDWPEAIENTSKIADMCQVDFTFGVYHLPEFHYPEGYTADTLFEKWCWDGYKRRYPDDPDGYQDRLNYEINMIKEMGFVDYFLIVSDFVNYAKSEDIPVGPGRGSAAGSMVAYCMGITDVDPMKYALYFERFLNPQRVTMPDIDMDFCYRRRGEVIEYVNRRYGSDHVAQIVTFGTLAAKGAIRDVGRVMGIPYSDTDKLSKLIPTAPHTTLDSAMEQSAELRDLYEKQFWVRNLIDMCKKVEGMPRHASRHAAGVVITRLPVHEYVPLARNDDAIVTQYIMTTLEELGLLKMDFLGLRNLTVLDDAQKFIRLRNPSFDIHTIPDNDPETFKMLQEGKTSGVFQMESSGMTGVCMQLKASSIEDLTAIVALYRPGPMESIPKFVANKMDPSKISYLHPSLEPILKVTYGCIVYQEQVMMIFQKLAGYSLGGADMVRRAISKKKAQQIQQEEQAFIYGDPKRGIKGCIANGIPESVAKNIYSDIYDFANYAFNKAHAVCYAILAYQTAYFKCHYPCEYMAALLTSVLDTSEKVAMYIGECRDMGIALLPPDINESYADFTVSNGNIRFGLGAIKNVGQSLVQNISRERAENGRFLGLRDFCERIIPYGMNKRALENMIKCGALDCLGYKRSQMLDTYGNVVNAIIDNRKRNLDGQFDLFGDFDELSIPQDPPMPNKAELSKDEMMRMEHETTGLYISGHPMDQYRAIAKEKKAQSIGQIKSDIAQDEENQLSADGRKVCIAGVISSVKRITTKNNKSIAYITIEDDTAAIEAVCFEKTLNSCGLLLEDGAVRLFNGRIRIQDEKPPQLIISWIEGFNVDEAAERQELENMQNMKADPESNVKKLFIRLPSRNDPRVRKIESYLVMFIGNDKLMFYFEDTGEICSKRCWLHPSLRMALEQLLGATNVSLPRPKDGSGDGW